MFYGGYVPCNCDLRCVPITTMPTATDPTTGMSLLYLFLYLICSEMIALMLIRPTHSISSMGWWSGIPSTPGQYSQLRPPPLPPPCPPRAPHPTARVSLLCPARRVPQSSVRHLMAALLQVYHSYQSASHLPCATQPCLAPFALISFIIFQGRVDPLAALVAGLQLHDTAGSSIVN